MSDLLNQIQQVLGDRYIIEREVGRGGMAYVYLARDRRYERQVAIKVLDPDIATAVGAERFLREIRITAQLQHPHIVALIDSGEARNLLYAVMPFVEGESLRDRLMANARLSTTEAVTIAWEVADALDYAHRRGVVHRDIKPENILVSNGHALVADFGIARAIGLAGGATLTGVGFPIGTAAYMSPEQATAASPVDGRSDIYSLGCVLYEMLAGRMAFSGPSLKSVLTQQLTTDPPLAHISRPDIPQNIVAMVRRCLRKQPEERYQSAGELAEDLRGALSDLPRLSTPAPRPPAAEMPLEDGDGLLAAAGRWIVPAALLAIVLLGVMFAYRQRGSRQETGEPTGPYTASVAVLPFTSLGGGQGNDYFSEGITDEIINQLAQVESLKVISRTSVLALKGSPLTLPQIADTLGVRHIVEGSVRRQGTRVRVTAELIEAASDAHLWSGTFEGDLADSFRVQEEIARKVSGELLTNIRGVRPMTPRAMPTKSAAFDALLLGRHLMEQRSPEAVEGATRAFRDAIRADSGYAPAYAGLSAAYVLHIVYGFPGGLDPYVAVARALALAERAVELDPALADAYIARSDALLISLAPHEQVLRALREARQLTPGSVGVYLSVAHALEHMGRWDAALQQAQRAIALDPLSTGVRHSTIAIALGARQYDVAIEEARRALAFDPEDQIAEMLLGNALLLKGDAQTCAELGLGPWLATKAICLHEAGRTAEGQALADSLAGLLGRGEYAIVPQFAALAGYQAWLGDAAGSIAWLQRAADISPMVHYWHRESGLFDRVMRDSTFVAGLARMESGIRARVADARRELGDRLE
ncbi:MAG: protein kinase domain-containing protein [Gemmatimonadales bacterium]